jgi:2-dehydro-3-deoxygluconokinase
MRPPIDREFDIVAIGEPMFEFNQTPDGRMWLGGLGGDTSNTAIAAARLGARVSYFTALGDDAFGSAFREAWAAEGVDASSVLTDTAAHTAVYFVTHGPDGHTFSYLRAGSAASRMKASDIPVDLIRRARVLHVSAISQAISPTACDAIFAAIHFAREAGTVVSYDTNLRLRLWPIHRARAVIEATAALCDIVRPGLDDARQLTGLSDADAIVDYYLALGAKLVGLTLGKDGALIATPETRRFIPPIACDAIDATGAGDAFDGAFLTRWLETGDPFDAGVFANAAAGLSTEGYGAVNPLPNRAQVEARLTVSR